MLLKFAVIGLLLVAHTSRAIITDPLTTEESKSLVVHFAASHTPLQWDLVASGSERVLLFGEAHIDNETRAELIVAMKSFRAKGITHMGLEALGDDNTELLRSYFETGEGGQAILSKLKQQWHWEPESYFELIEAARENAIQIIPLDISFPEFSKLAETPDRRDERMAGNIMSVLKADPKARMIVLAGSNHVRSWAIPSHLDKGTSAKSFSVLSRKDFLAVAKAAELKQKALIEAPQEQREKRGWDFYIFLPEILQRSR